MKIIDLTPIATLSSNSILKLLTYICTDVVEDRDSPNSIQDDLKIIQWITENSGLDFSASSQDTSNTTRFIKLILQKILTSITNTTVVNVLGALQVLKKHPLIINLYRHCIALIRKIEKTYTISEIANFDQLSREALLETLTYGENYHCLGSSDISVPPHHFQQIWNNYLTTLKNLMETWEMLLYCSTKKAPGRVEIYEYADENEIRAQEEFIRYLYTDKVELTKTMPLAS
ncbi:hypothetical protein FDP41_010245 [Naegleria fowleri]|uniref:Uncharacterized protein n=1 Tax=Naegleria fowleri TaxID=5763 RepID=A0A6A5B852_NAEFO|nr:uncharacterized protein FDP41_010245 [Naegleria fowleri]KAF0971472.1 hypothetical protein FDP41_010245 [Naegleria fowleri]